MPVWPAEMPHPIHDSLRLSGPVNAVIRTSMDIGPNKVRPRMTSAPQQIEVSYGPLSSTLCISFEAFFANDLSMGALAFDMKHPLTREVRRFRFLGSYELSRIGRDAYRLDCSLELLP